MLTSRTTDATRLGVIPLPPRRLAYALRLCACKTPRRSDTCRVICESKSRVRPLTYSMAHASRCVESHRRSWWNKCLFVTVVAKYRSRLLTCSLCTVVNMQIEACLPVCWRNVSNQPALRLKVLGLSSMVDAVVPIYRRAVHERYLLRRIVDQG